MSKNCARLALNMLVWTLEQMLPNFQVFLDLHASRTGHEEEILFGE
jgi:hypothetical protein